MTWQELKDEVDRQIAELPEEQRVADIWYIDLHVPSERNLPEVIWSEDQNGLIIS